MSRWNDQLKAALERLVGRYIGRRYRIDALIGIGGMGAVFRGYDTSVDREVAIKILRPELTDSAEAIARFSREARAISRLEHPNCVRVTDVGQIESGLRYMVMDLLIGTPLTNILGEPLPLVRALDIARQVLNGLAHAHHRGIVHRDIKPDNILLTVARDGRELVKLVDFGIARVLVGRDMESFSTQAGHIFGTPQYMSPEQASGKEVDHRADLYTTGLVLYEMLAGKRAFDAPNAVAIVTKQLLEEPEPLDPQLPATLRHVVQRLLAKAPDSRYASAAEALAHLDAVVSEVFQAHAQSMARQPAPPTAFVPPRRQPAAPVDDAQAIENALRVVLSSSTERAIEGLGDTGPSPKGTVTQLTGIDLDNLQLEDIGDCEKAED